MNNIKINSVLHVLKTVNLLLPTPCNIDTVINPTNRRENWSSEKLNNFLRTLQWDWPQWYHNQIEAVLEEYYN